jgi:DNA-binding CsgD family transcriptional regulator
LSTARCCPRTNGPPRWRLGDSRARPTWCAPTARRSRCSGAPTRCWRPTAGLVLFVALSTSRWGARFRRDVSAEGQSGRLSRREREIVELIALGHSGPEIAHELHIAHETVRTHVRNAMVRLGARSRAHLVAKALAEGLIAT